MKPTVRAEKLVGTRCTQCSFEGCVLYLTSGTTLIGSVCNTMIDADPKQPEYNHTMHTLTLVFTEGEPRYFIVPKVTGPEEILEKLLEAYVRLDETSQIAWTGAEMVQTIFQLLQHGLEDIGVKEIQPGEIKRSWIP